jgi:hypothetical protein
MEARLTKDGRGLDSYPLSELDAAWDGVKGVENT